MLWKVRCGCCILCTNLGQSDSQNWLLADKILHLFCSCNLDFLPSNPAGECCFHTLTSICHLSLHSKPQARWGPLAGIRFDFKKDGSCFAVPLNHIVLDKQTAGRGQNYLYKDTIRGKFEISNILQVAVKFLVCKWSVLSFGFTSSPLRKVGLFWSFCTGKVKGGTLGRSRGIFAGKEKLFPAHYLPLLANKSANNFTFISSDKKPLANMLVRSQ